MAATSSNPEILEILFLDNDRRVKYLSGGIFTILLMVLEDKDNFSTRTNVLSTDVYSLSMGGFYSR